MDPKVLQISLINNARSILYDTKLVDPTNEIVAEACDKAALILYKAYHLLGASRPDLSEKSDGQGKSGE